MSAERGRTHGKLPSAMQSQTSLERFLIVVVVGLVAGLVAAFFAPWQLAIVIGWDTAAVLYIASVWAVVSRFSPTETSALATREDSSRVVTSVLLLSAALVSLVGTALVLV